MKLSTLAGAAVLACVAGAAHAADYTYTGDTTGAPTFNRPFTLTSLSGVGTAVAYDALAFSVTVDGSYDFLSSTGGAFDNFTLLYSPTFDPSSGLSNLLALNDDFNFSTSESGFSAMLTAGSAYVLVTTGYDNTDFGAYSNTISGPGMIVAVPEPGTYALMALGLAAVGGIARRRAKAANA